MFWILLLIAVAVMVLAATDRLEAIDTHVARFFRKLKLAWEYVQEDCDDLESEIREHSRAARARKADPATADAEDTAAQVEPGVSHH